MNSTTPETRKPRADKGQVRATARDIALLRWVGEMYAARLDQVQILLARLSEDEEMRAKGQVSPSVTRDALGRWTKAGLVRSRKILANEEAWLWLSPKGLRTVGFKEPDFTYRNWEASASKLPHYYLVNKVRLALEARHGEDIEWTSERTLLMQKKDKHGHTIDGLAERKSRNRRFTNEIEVTPKKPAEIKEIMLLLLEMPDIDAHWYWVNDKTTHGIERCRASLSEADRKKIIITHLNSIQ